MNLFLKVTEGTDIICGSYELFKIIKFFFKILDIVFFIIPMILIVLITFSIAKNVIARNEDNMKK